MYRSVPSILHSNILGDTKETMKIIKQNNQCAGQDSKRARHEYKETLLSLLLTFSMKKINARMSNIQTGEDQHAYVVYTASQRTINNIFLYRNIQKKKQELRFRLLLAFMKQKRSHQHCVLHYRSGKRNSFISQIKVKQPLTGLERPRGFQEVKVPRFRDNFT